MNQSIGEKIIAACAGLTCIADCNFKVSPWAMVVFRPGSAEQLEAVVEAHIEERVAREVDYRMRLNLKLDHVADTVTDKDRKMIQDYIDKKYPDVAPPYPTD